MTNFKRAAYYRRRVKAGKCWTCGKKVFSKTLCKKHLLELRKKSRARGGFHPWTKTHRGRVPTEMRAKPRPAGD